jgi:hypothetical protein
MIESNDQMTILSDSDNKVSYVVNGRYQTFWLMQTWF